uniref:Transmembrane protein n=1 Tax=Glycine max TaxID=3847 RepID=C6T9B0_SOYBN|nr:unknown [Glycine max]
MDIEPLWAIGGWSFLSNYCMAEPKASSSSSPISEPFSKSPSFLHFLSLFFILLLLINLSHQPHPSTMASSEKKHQIIRISHAHHKHAPSEHPKIPYSIFY